MTDHYFTVFDKNYAARGLLMLESLKRHSTGRITSTVLALDDDAAKVSEGFFDRVIRVDDIGDEEFTQSRERRTHEEFCWSCAPVLSSYILRTIKEGDIGIYLDADLYFFSDPRVLLDEMGSDKNIMIHPHRFCERMKPWESSSGTFNVGFVAFRQSQEARTCAARWREQVLALCVKDPERGLCGDQGYLNEWPGLYRGLHVMQNIGGGTAPWNVEDYSVTMSKSTPSVDGTPMVFFHFHQLRIVAFGSLQFYGAVPAEGYEFGDPVYKFIYDRYLRALKSRSLRIAYLIPVKPDFSYDIRELQYYLGTGRIQAIGLIGLLSPHLLQRAFRTVAPFILKLRTHFR